MNKIIKTIQIIFVAAMLLASFFLILSTFNILGFQLFSVQSGSMEPSLKTGSLVLTTQSESYQEGDIVTFVQEKGYITHRIKSKNPNGDGFIVKGDANSSADLDPVLNEDIIGKAVFSIPYFGYFSSFLKTPVGLIIFIIIPATIIVYEEINIIKKEIILAIDRKKEGLKGRVSTNNKVKKKLKLLDGLKFKRKKKAT